MKKRNVLLLLIISALFIVSCSDKTPQLFSPRPNAISGTFSFPLDLVLYDHGDGEKIYYTDDGTEPTEESIVYTDPIHIENDTTIKAIAVKPGYKTSKVATMVYTFKVADLLITPDSGVLDSLPSISIHTRTPDAVIYYTTDGSTPTKESTLYNGDFKLSDGATIIKAIGFKGDWAASDIATSEYSFKVASPVLTLSSGTYNTPQELAITQEGCIDVYYTIDGTVPTAESTHYDGAIPLNSDTTVKAIAIIPGFAESEVVEGVYKFKVATPVITPNKEKFIMGLDKLTIECETPGAEIYYSDGGALQKYTGPFDLNRGSYTIKAVAKFTSWPDSDEASIENLFVGYGVGGKGWAGGTIVYNCDADNESGNADGLKSTECGWRYIECAPNDLIVEGQDTFIFGYNRIEADGANQKIDTEDKIGAGLSNTQKLVSAMQGNAFLSETGATRTALYAAKLCDDYVLLNTTDDWFLPSADELTAIYETMSNYDLDIGISPDTYMSSSEADGNNVKTRNLGSPDLSTNSRGDLLRVRPCRYFYSSF